MRVIELHPGVKVCSDPLSIALLGLSAAIGVDVGPVVPHVRSSRVNIYTHKLVLEAVLTLGFLCFFFEFTALLKFLFCHSFLLLLLFEKICLRGLILLFLEPVLGSHDFKETVGFQVKHLREFAKRVHFICLESFKVESDSLQVDNQDVWSF